MKKLLLTFFVFCSFCYAATIATKPDEIVKMLPNQVGEWQVKQDQVLTPNNEMYIVRTYDRGANDILILGITISPIKNNQATSSANTISSIFNTDYFSSLCGNTKPVDKIVIINGFDAVETTYTCNAESFGVSIQQNGIEVNLFNDAKQKESGYKYTISLYSMGVGQNMQAVSIDEMIDFINQLNLQDLASLLILK
jgi:hypothetical protein